MRSIRTCILRLLVDPAEPQALRGALQTVPESASYTFADEQGLLAALQEIVHSMPESVTSEHSQLDRPKGGE
jgi:hypothetical protein